MFFPQTTIFVPFRAHTVLHLYCMSSSLIVAKLRKAYVYLIIDLVIAKISKDNAIWQASKVFDNVRLFFS